MWEHIVAGILFAVVALGALRAIVGKKFPFLRPWADDTNRAYIALAIAAAGLLGWSLFGDSLKNLKVNSFEAAGLKLTVGSLEKKVDSISAQMKVFYAGKIIEEFNKKNWSQVRTVRAGREPRFVLEVTLREKPIPNSIDVFEGVMQMPEQDYHLDGRKLQFPANSNKPDLGLTIKYYPDVTAPETPKP